MNYNLIYFNHREMKLKTVLLETSFFDDKKTGSNLSIDLKRVVYKFELQEKIIILVEDGASNNTLAFTEISKDPDLKVVLRVVCVNHKIHNLLYTDVFNSKHYFNKPLNDVITKLKKVYRKLHYKKSKLDDIIKRNHSKETWENILDLLENHDEESFDGLFEVELNNNSLKRNNPTRWSSTLGMLKSFLTSFEAVNDLLFKEKEHALLITEDEQTIMADLVSVFEIFENAVKVLQVKFIEYITYLSFDYSLMSLVFQFLDWFVFFVGPCVGSSSQNQTYS